MAEQQFYVGVHGVIVNRARMLVLKRAPEMAYKPGSWDLPGGHLALGESAEECLLREVKEETALDIGITDFLGINVMNAEPYLQAIYACRLTVFQKITLRPREHVESRWVTPAELETMEMIPYLARILARGMLKFVK